MGKPGVEKSPAQRRLGRTLVLYIRSGGRNSAVLSRSVGGKLCKSPVFENGPEKYLKIFYRIFTRFGGTGKGKNQMLWINHKNP